jgi:cytochrome P450
MGSNRVVFDKLKSQIREKFPKVEDITWTALKDMDYLDAVISETMRYLAIPQFQRIRVVPQGGAQIDGHFVPEGTTVAVADYAATHLPINFKDPYAFRPERWLDKDNTDKKQLHQPFSYGPRNCIGKNLAGIEMRLAIANVLWHFDMEIESIEGENWRWNPKDDFMHMKAFNLVQLPPMWMRLTKAVR